jgi:hypothetical protein
MFFPVYLKFKLLPANGIEFESFEFENHILSTGHWVPSTQISKVLYTHFLKPMEGQLPSCVFRTFFIVVAIKPMLLVCSVVFKQNFFPPNLFAYTIGKPGKCLYIRFLLSGVFSFSFEREHAPLISSFLFLDPLLKPQTE